MVISDDGLIPAPIRLPTKFSDGGRVGIVAQHVAARALSMSPCQDMMTLDVTVAGRHGASRRAERAASKPVWRGDPPSIAGARRIGLIASTAP